MKPTPRRLRRSVLPVRNRNGAIGTATAVSEGLALTALHVIAWEDPATLRLGCDPGLVVCDVATLPLTDYQRVHEQASRSLWRAQAMVGDTVDALGTVDLALLAVPGLNAPPLQPRERPVEVGEHVVVPGYPGGQWSITRGPVTGADDADFAVRLLLGPGASGSPVVDQDGRLVGVVTLDHEVATICVGPGLLAAFLGQFLAVSQESGLPR
ncbi:hypothetical protein GCM10023321_73100 [Pseudonocardia eucalypti]|uniref:Serine protease n=1 Tax=Pseudonocardia eucalypti TaxID=648755 RepID=A0ABP9R8B0_9PSEU|nr:S1-C subfamily serine protease [Pseudonocardia eucalypti]